MLLIVGERRSPLAVKRGVRWEDEAQAAKPLFAALRACGVDPLTQCRFVNWFEGGAEVVREHTGTIVALGRKVQRALDTEGIEHIPLVHPAARGAIRLRSNYIAHVASALAVREYPMPRLPAVKPTIAQLEARARGGVSPNHPVPGWFKLRLTRGGPWVPARIVWCEHEPGDPDNLLDTGPYLVATIGEANVDPLIVWERGRRIEEDEYGWRMQLRTWAQAHAPGQPEAPDNVAKKVDLTRQPSLF